MTEQYVTTITVIVPTETKAESARHNLFQAAGDLGLTVLYSDCRLATQLEIKDHKDLFN